MIRAWARLEARIWRSCGGARKTRAVTRNCPALLASHIICYQRGPIAIMAVGWHSPRAGGMRQCSRMSDGRTPELCLIEMVAEFGARRLACGAADPGFRVIRQERTTTLPPASAPQHFRIAGRARRRPETGATNRRFTREGAVVKFFFCARYGLPFLLFGRQTLQQRFHSAQLSLRTLAVDFPTLYITAFHNQ
jgi:hypothetical protein